MSVVTAIVVVGVIVILRTALKKCIEDLGTSVRLRAEAELERAKKPATDTPA